MKLLCVIGVVILMMQGCFAPPVTKTKDDHDANAENEVDNKPESEFDLHYQRYLNEVVQALENDPEFRKKLEVAPKEDFSTGKIAHELEFVNHRVRRQLDEIKRNELTRLSHLATREYELEKNLDLTRSDFADHLDHENPHKFEIEDLKRLIHKATADLAEVDKKRREEFKKYEMEKKFEEELKVKEMTEDEKKKYVEELEHVKEKQKKHEPLHHPGSKQQLEEVWEKQDDMVDQEFDARAFFQLHDLDSNGHWDQDEVKILFLKELNKTYAGEQTDQYERAEEMERMRETVFNETDLDRDGLISSYEFLENTKKANFQQDPEWKPINDQDVYTSEEYESFSRQREAEIRKMIADGLLPPQPHFGPDGQIQEYGYPHPGQVPVNDQQYHGQPPQYQGQQHQIPNQQYQQQHPPQYQQIPGQHQQQYQQVPIQQHPNQIPQHVGQNNIQPNQQVYQQQLPQYQVPQHQVPQQIPIQNAPQHQIPVQNAPQHQIPVQNVPQHQIPVQNTQQINQAQPIVQQNNQVHNIQNNSPQQQQNQQSHQSSQQHLSNEVPKITSNEIKT